MLCFIHSIKRKGFLPSLFTWYQSHRRFGLGVCHVFNSDNSSNSRISFRPLQLHCRKYWNSSSPSNLITVGVLFRLLRRRPLLARYHHHSTCWQLIYPPEARTLTIELPHAVTRVSSSCSCPSCAGAWVARG